MRGKGNARIASRETLSGAIVCNVALDKNGLPLLGNSLKFLTVGRESGSIKERGKASTKTDADIH